METKTRIKAIVSHTVEDFYNSVRYTSESTETLIEWLSNDLMLVNDIEDLTTIEISLLTLKKLNSLDLVNLSFIIETITETLKNSDNEMIHVAIPKIL